MGTLQKIAVIVVATGVITAATLPGRQTVAVVGSFQKLFTGAEHTAITGSQ